MSDKVVMISGGFDPIRPHHLRLIQEAKKLGDKVVAATCKDDWLIAKKGFVFQPLSERVEHLEALGCEVVIEDVSVVDSILEVRPDIYVISGEWTVDGLPKEEQQACVDVHALIMKVDIGTSNGSTEFIEKMVEKVVRRNVRRAKNGQP